MGVAGNGAADAAGIGVGRVAEGRSIWTTSLMDIEIENRCRAVVTGLSLMSLEKWAELTKLVIRNTIEVGMVWWCL